MEFVPEKWWIRGTLVLHVCRTAKTKEFLSGQKHVFHAQFKSVGKNNLCILSNQTFLKFVTNLKIDWSTWNFEISEAQFQEFIDGPMGPNFGIGAMNNNISKIDLELTGGQAPYERKLWYPFCIVVDTPTAMRLLFYQPYLKLPSFTRITSRMIPTH